MNPLVVFVIIIAIAGITGVGMAWRISQIKAESRRRSSVWPSDDWTSGS